MAVEHKAGQKRKRSVPYEGRKSTRKPIKFKKQEYYNSSSEDEAEPIPAWRNSTVASKTGIQEVDKQLQTVQDAADVEVHDVSSSRQTAAAIETESPPKPITFADLVEPVNSKQTPAHLNQQDSGLLDVTYFDTTAPIQLSDDEVLDEQGTDSDDQEDDKDVESGGREREKYGVAKIKDRLEAVDNTESSDTSDGEVDEYDMDSDDATTTNASTTTRALRKRNDPTAFAASISAILGSKLTAAKRADPILSRSAAAAGTVKELAEDKLEAKARRKLRADKNALMEKGRVRDVLGLDRDHAKNKEEKLEVSTGALVEKEKQLRKTAQRGVVKLFNAVRAAQMKGFEAENEVRKEGKIGIDGRKERVTEMSKKGFLDLLAAGG